MKTIEEIKAELKATAGYGSNILALTVDGKGTPLVLHFSNGVEAWALEALEARECLGLRLMQLETATTPEEAQAVIRQALAALKIIEHNEGEFMADHDATDAEPEIEAACKKFGFDFDELKEKVKGDHYEAA